MESFNCKKWGAKITGMNCAYELALYFKVKAKKTKHSWCKCRIPIRANEIKEKYYDGYLDDDMDATDYKFIYWKTSEGTGHVYFGTYEECIHGNGWPASSFSIVEFHRYEYFDGISASDY